ncbi:MAG: hypothetical protein QW597_04440 [Thermoplasmataceae archaeon]
MSGKDICEECNGTGYSGPNGSDICNSCMGLGSRYRVLHGIFSNEDKTSRFGFVAMILLGMVIMAIFSSTGQIRVRWILRLTGFYILILMAGLMYNIISIPRYFMKIFNPS